MTYSALSGTARTLVGGKCFLSDDSGRDSATVLDGYYHPAIPAESSTIGSTAHLLYRWPYSVQWYDRRDGQLYGWGGGGCSIASV